MGKRRSRRHAVAAVLGVFFGACGAPALVREQAPADPAGQGSWAPATLAHVEAALARAPKVLGAPRPVAVFDFDDTMIRGDVSYALMRLLADEDGFAIDPAGAGSLFDAVARARYAARDQGADEAARAAGRAAWRYELLDAFERVWRRGQKAEACAVIARLLTGMSVPQVQALALRAVRREQGWPLCEEVLAPPDAGRPPLPDERGVRARPAIRGMLDRLARAGVEVWVVSASPQHVVEAVAAALYGVPPERVLGVRSREAAGVLTDEVLPPITYGPGKVDAIRRHIGRRPLLAFGDAWTDLEMLTDAEAGVLIDRGTADLKAALARTGTVVVQPRFADEPAPAPCPR